MGAAMAVQQDDERRWFLVNTHLKQEKVAIENLDRQSERLARQYGRDVFEAYCPWHVETVTPRGQPPRTLTLPFFPRYLFVRVDLGIAAWRAVYNTRGISGVMMSSAVGSRMLGRLVEELKAREEDGLFKLDPSALRCPFKPGDVVSWGAFRDAIFTERVDGTRCRILIKGLFGRDSAPIVDLADIESR